MSQKSLQQASSNQDSSQSNQVTQKAQSWEAHYDPARFRQDAHKLVDLLADYLELAGETRELKALNYQDPDQTYQQLSKWFSASTENPQGLDEFYKRVMHHSIRLQSPRYLGHQMSPPINSAVLSAWLGEFLDNGTGIYEMGQVSSVMERVVCEWVAEKMGLGGEAGGVLTSGGTLGNLTALLGVRQVMGQRLWPDCNPWHDGLNAVTYMVADQAHYCVERATRVMGLGSQGVTRVATDRRFRLDPEALDRSCKLAQEQGVTPICVVSSNCSTSTGAFDPIEEIADFCREKNLWLHVDAAHGGSLCFSKKYQEKLKGIHLADSVVMDFHKTAMVPALVTAVIFRNHKDSYKTFEQNAQYLWNSDQTESLPWQELAKRTYECTKTMMSLKVAGVVAEHGDQVFGDYVERVIDQTRDFNRYLTEHPDFEVAVEPECNIICFRVLAGNEQDELNQINMKVREQIRASGDFYIVSTVLNDIFYLRCTITNPMTQMKDLEDLCSEIIKIRDEIKDEIRS